MIQGQNSKAENRRNRLAALVLSLALLLSPSVAYAAEYIIFRIDGEAADLKMGQALDEGDNLEIPEGVTVQLVSKAGEIVTLTGPGLATITTETEDPEAETTLKTISTLLFSDARFIKTLGGSRSVASSPQSGDSRAGDNPWQPVISADQEYCLEAGNPVIHRRIKDPEWKVTVQIPGTGERVEYNWVGGASELRLAGLPETPQDEYLARIPGRAGAIVIHTASETPVSLLGQLEWMAERGCREQALKLLEQAAAKAN